MLYVAMFEYHCCSRTKVRMGGTKTPTNAFEPQESPSQIRLKCSKFLRSSKCLKTTWYSSGQPVELTQKLATETAEPHSWYSYVVTIVDHYNAAVIEDL